MYATRGDLEARFGAVEIANLEAMQTEPDAVEQALQDASEEIDSYIAVAYTLPLPLIPSTLKRVACNIARYRLYFQQPTEEVEKRYESEVAYLKRIADKKAVLPILDEDDKPTGELPQQSPATMPIGTTYRGGMFADDILNQMPSLK
ncbi:gp436 family protein [Acinetobacter haemolyticus]|uniref:gp436 family protein n=1 Tax=Acinetobacter haemolyticus TaxID=29430 RepID=UPI00325A7451